MERIVRIAVIALILGPWLIACGVEEEGEGIYVPPPTNNNKPQKPPPSTSKSLPSALQSVVSHIDLPTSGKDHGLDLDGDGVVDNQVGRLIGQLRSLLNLELQPAVDEELKAGKGLVLYDLHANSLVDDGDVELRVYIGEDKDQDPSDNFSGTERFDVNRDVVAAAVLPAAIAASRLSSTTPERAFASLPFRTTTAVLPLVATRIQARVSAGGMQEGVLAGAIPMAEAAKRLTQVLTAELDQLYKRPDVSKNTYQALRVLLDQDGDGTITEAEFTASNAFANPADVMPAA